MTENYITNPDAQQGESAVRKSSRAPANFSAKVHPTVPPEDSIDEGPVAIPGHPEPSVAETLPHKDVVREKPGVSLGNWIGHKAP